MLGLLLVFVFSIMSCAQGCMMLFVNSLYMCRCFFPNCFPYVLGTALCGHVGLFKFNCDVAVNAQQGMVSYGTVIQNHEGLVLLSGADIGVYFDDVNFAEVEALCFGFSLAREAGLSLLIITSDLLYVT